jgi:hypothetical protein
LATENVSSNSRPSALRNRFIGGKKMRISIGSFLALTFLVADAASAQNLSGNWGNICGGNLRFQERPGVVEFDCDNVDFHHSF